MTCFNIIKTNMGKNKVKYPFVSICTPTFNRRPFIPIIIRCFLNQTYPRSKIEWIIVDDGTDKVEDIIKGANIPEIKYISLPEKITLGAKRNLMHKHATGSIIVYMDDDDYYPPERVAHAVETLQLHPRAMVVGSSEMYVYFKHINKMYQSGPFGPTHATAATFAFRTELLKDTQYENEAALAEEKAFLKNYTVPMAQLDPLKTILVFAHDQNSFDKRTLLATGENPTFKVSPKTIPMFIRSRDEKPIMDFFLKDIDEKLRQYSPGDPKNKPDVLKQLETITKQRQQQQQQQQNMGQQKLMIQTEGGPPKELTVPEIINILQGQQHNIATLTNTIAEKDNQIRELTDQIRKLSSQKPVTEYSLPSFIPTQVQTVVKNKTDPEVFVPMDV